MSKTRGERARTLEEWAERVLSENLKEIGRHYGDPSACEIGGCARTSEGTVTRKAVTTIYFQGYGAYRVCSSHLDFYRPFRLPNGQFETPI